MSQQASIPPTTMDQERREHLRTSLGRTVLTAAIALAALALIAVLNALL
jgi:hypothetical protein